MSDIIKLADHRPPVVYTISVEHHWDGRVVAYAMDVSDDARSKEIVWDTLMQLLTDYRDCGEPASESANRERAAIVAWLRKEAIMSTDTVRRRINKALDQIEAGEHLK